LDIEALPDLGSHGMVGERVRDRVAHKCPAYLAYCAPCLTGAVSREKLRQLLKGLAKEGDIR
jgi:hypothetical protein